MRAIDRQDFKTTNKAELRREARKRRDELSAPDVSQKGEEITRRLLELDEFVNAGTIMCYLSIGNEVPTWDLARYILNAGKVLTVPKITAPAGESKRMIACKITDLESGLKPGSFGIMEPADESLQPVPIPDIDLVIVPGLLFDRRGFRIGYGGGFYDSFLRNKGAGCTSVGICYELQLVPELPAEEHDVPVDIVITESAVYRI